MQRNFESKRRTSARIANGFLDKKNNLLKLLSKLIIGDANDIP